MNIFSAITSGLQAYNSLSGLNKPTQQPSQDPTWEGMLWPINPTDTRTTLQKLAPKISEVWSKIENSNIVKNISKNVNPIIDTVYSATAKPIVDQVKYTSNINNVKKPYQEQLSSLWLTMQKLDELGLSEEEKQAVKNIYDQVGVEIPGINEQVPVQEDLWVLWSLKEWAIGASRVGQYLPEIAGNIGGMVPWLLGEGAGLIGGAFWVEKKDNPVYQNLKAGQKLTENIGKSIVAPGEVWLTEWQKSARRAGATTALTLPVGGWYLKWAKWVWNLAGRSGLVGAWIWSTEPVIQKGSDASVEDVVKWWLVGWTVGAAVPLAGALLWKTWSAIKKWWEALYKTAIKPTADEARMLIKASARWITPPTTRADTALKYGISGTEKQLWVKWIRASDKIFQETINPAIEKSKALHNIDDIFAIVEKQISSEWSALRKQELMEWLQALKKDFATTGKKQFTTKDLQLEKSSLDQFTPAKIFKWKDVAQGYNQVKNTLANIMREQVREDLGKVWVKNAKELYKDWANLTQLEDIGVKWITENWMRWWYWGFWTTIYDKLATPIKTTGGKYIYKLWNWIEYVWPKWLDTLEKFLKSKGYKVTDWVITNLWKNVNSALIRSPIILGNSNSWMDRNTIK